MRNINDLLGMPVMALQEGTRLGKLSGFEIDAREGRIRYLHFDGDHRPSGLVAWEAVRSIGEDAITVASVTDVRQDLTGIDRDGLTSRIGDRPVVTESGDSLGRITSYDVDEKSGRIVNYRIAAGGLLGRLRHDELVFTHAQIHVFGRDAVVVGDDVCAAKAA